MLPAQEFSRVRIRTRPVTGRRRRKETKAKKPSCSHASDGFLNHWFTPLIDSENAFINKHDTEKSFFDSLANLVNLYGFIMPDISDQFFPNNLRESFNSACEQLKILRPGLELILFQSDDHPACLCTLKTYNTSSTLFYIPVEKLYNLLRSKKSKCKALLLLSAFAYFKQAGDIPFYEESDSFVGSQYEMISEWTLNEPDEWEKEDHKSAVADLELLSRTGKILNKRLNDPVHLRQLEKRISRFKPQSKNDTELLETCAKIHAFYERYGNRSIMDSVIPGFSHPNEDERIYAEQYISFCWSDTNWTFDHLTEMVNSVFQECIAIDEPCSIQLFDRPQLSEQHSLEFESNFFDLLILIIDTLTDLS